MSFSPNLPFSCFHAINFPLPFVWAMHNTTSSLDFSSFFWSFGLMTWFHLSILFSSKSLQWHSSNGLYHLCNKFIYCRQYSKVERLYNAVQQPTKFGPHSKSIPWPSFGSLWLNHLATPSLFLHMEIKLILSWGLSSIPEQVFETEAWSRHKDYIEMMLNPYVFRYPRTHLTHIKCKVNIITENIYIHFQFIRHEDLSMIPTWPDVYNQPIQKTKTNLNCPSVLPLL